MNIMTSRPRTRVSVQAPFGGVTDWYPDPRLWQLWLFLFLRMYQSRVWDPLFFASPAGVLELDTYSSLEADPSESSPPPVSVAPMVSPILCSDNSESDTEMPERHVSPTPHDDILIRWRSRFPLTPVVAPPRIRQRRAILIRPEEDIPISRLYRTHPGGLCRALTARKSVRPLPSHCLALRYTLHHLDRFNSESSSSYSSSDHSSSGHSISGHSLSGHTSPDTTIADSSTPPRFVYPPLARTLRYSKAYLC
ncbi:hypothetical protein Tco_0322297 [Tanacetum coccineum]